MLSFFPKNIGIQKGIKTDEELQLREEINKLLKEANSYSG